MLLIILVLTVLILIVVSPFFFFLRGEKTMKRFRKTLILNVSLFFGVMILMLVFILTRRTEAAELSAAAVSPGGMQYIAAALAVGLGSIGCGIAVASSASAAIGAISENEGIFGKTLVYVGLSEGVAIYGLLIALMILFM